MHQQPSARQQSEAEGRRIIDRIVADNDPRNGGVAQRLIRMCEHPEMEPDADSLYPDAPEMSES